MMLLLIVFVFGGLTGSWTVLYLLNDPTGRRRMRRESTIIVLILIAAVVMSLADPAEAHDLPDGTPHLSGPLTVEKVLTRMEHIAAWSSWLEHEQRVAELRQVNGPYRSPRHSAPVSPLPVRAVAPSVEQWRPLVAAYFEPGDVEWAMRVMQCESGGNPDAANPTSSARGLFQHLGRYWPDRSARAGWEGADILDPEANVAVAAWLYYTGGPGHWVCK